MQRVVKLDTTFLDGVRGLMALWVFFSHVIQAVDGPQIFLVKGGIAVDVFMLVSGLLMFYTVYSRRSVEPWGERSTWIYFMVRRFFRIAPLYYILLIIAVVLAGYYRAQASDLAERFGRHMVDSACGELTWLDIVSNLVFVHGLIPCNVSSNILPDWSLSLEMQFYLFFPVLLFTLLRAPTMLTAVALFFVYMCDRYIAFYAPDVAKLIFYPQPSLLVAKLHCFLAGMVAMAMAVGALKVNVKNILIFLVLVVFHQRLTFSLIALFLLGLLVFQNGHFGRLGGLGIWSVGRKFLSSVGARFLGDISYGLYLLHLLVLFPMAVWMSEAGWLVGGGWYRFVLLSASSLVIILPFAWMFHRVVEVRFIRLGKRVVDRLRATREPILQRG